MEEVLQRDRGVRGRNGVWPFCKAAQEWYPVVTECLGVKGWAVRAI